MISENYSAVCREMSGELAFNGETVVNYHIEYPQIEGNGNNIRAINRFFSAKAGAVLGKIKAIQYPMGVRQYRELWRINSFEPLQSWQSAQIMYNGTNIMSVFCDGFENNRCQGTMLYRESYTWNIAGGELLPVWSFFKTNMWKNLFIKEISAQIDRAQMKTPGSFYTDAKSKLGNMGGYYLTNEGFAVYYPCGVIASNGGAIPTFIIPYEKVNKIMAKPL